MIRHNFKKGVILSLIVARDEEYGIGRNGKIPWLVPQDLKIFRHFTTGNPCIMGRKTYESLGNPLKDRQNIVVSESIFHEHAHKVKPYNGAIKILPQSTIDMIELDGFTFVNSIHDACIIAFNVFRKPRMPLKGEVFIIGGAKIYQSFINSLFPIRRYYVSEIHGKHNCDTHLHELSVDDREFYVDQVELFDNHTFYIIQHNSLKGMPWKKPLPWMESRSSSDQ